LTASNGLHPRSRRSRRDFIRLLAGFSTASIVGLALLALVGHAAATAPATGQGPSADGPIVRCNPAAVTGFMHSGVSVEIYVEDVVDLYGADVRLSFDPAFVQVQDADPAAAGVQIEVLSDFLNPDFVVRKTADNIAGTIWYAATQVNPSPPVSGSGALARVTFLPQMAGDITVPVTYQKLALRTGVQIPATSQDCRLTFEQRPALFLPIVLRTSPAQSSRRLDAR
jgi:hypothetical protein